MNQQGSEERAMSKGDDTTTVSVRLPRISIDITHSSSPDSASERLAISIEAAPSFAAFARYLDAGNPFAFWLQAMQFAWLPWLALQRLSAPTTVPDPPRRVLGTDRGREVPE
jgi:hypothetical protein